MPLPCMTERPVELLEVLVVELEKMLRQERRAGYREGYKHGLIVGALIGVESIADEIKQKVTAIRGWADYLRQNLDDTLPGRRKRTIDLPYRVIRGAFLQGAEATGRTVVNINEILETHLEACKNGVFGLASNYHPNRLPIGNTHTLAEKEEEAKAVA